ncbi:argininosuccinate lyase [uncultured Oscillibacter sp.]|uniref:argininosuccinate lyase n=1 Tax=uncultured Oscillibacter sp. TaxID=876091 RepID=UPI001F87B4E5|nr:argininosuccinate lyase [uncultured Oscillibacter sp.]HJB32080.1 argininosuccinate lyase [Candidatus Oscillibacter excrementavium]
MKLWGGRFQKETDQLVNELNASISFDQRLYREDITGSMAHARMLGDCGIISKEDAAAIIGGLQGILADIEAGKVTFTADNEDIHMNVEALLTARIGDAGKRLHTARSRNDQVALDFRMYVREQIPVMVSQLLELETVLCRQAKKYQTAVMPGYTHLQRAQPISFAQHLMAYASMFRRDVTRLEDCGKRLDECPLGSGALAGTTYPIDRWETAQALGFAAPMSNSLDGVSDRDYALELLSGLSILMMHLSRFAEEVILWCSWEFKFIELDDAYATGSSIMPQKKNPDVAELVRGKTGRVYGDLMSLLTVMKGLPLAYNKDMQEDKEPVFDAIDTVEMCLPVFAAMLDTMTVRTDNMRKAAGHGFINATDCADYLTKKGMPFRDAYTVTGHLVAQCTAQGKTLEELTLEELKAVSPLFEQDVYDALNLENCMALRSSYGGPAVSETTRQIGEIEQFINERTEKR